MDTKIIHTHFTTSKQRVINPDDFFQNTLNFKFFFKPSELNKMVKSSASSQDLRKLILKLYLEKSMRKIGKIIGRSHPAM